MEATVEGPRLLPKFLRHRLNGGADAACEFARCPGDGGFDMSR
jgi:hypothetical protein